MTSALALTLARTAGRGGAARAALSSVLGNTRKRDALGKRILAQTTAENRALYARFYGANFNDGRAWDLLVEMAAPGRRRRGRA